MQNYVCGTIHFKPLGLHNPIPKVLPHCSLFCQRSGSDTECEDWRDGAMSHIPMYLLCTLTTQDGEVALPAPHSRTLLGTL